MSKCPPCLNGLPSVHKIGALDATKKAAELLAKRGMIELWPQADMYRLKPKKGFKADRGHGGQSQC